MNIISFTALTILCTIRVIAAAEVPIISNETFSQSIEEAPIIIMAMAIETKLEKTEDQSGLTLGSTRLKVTAVLRGTADVKIKAGDEVIFVHYAPAPGKNYKDSKYKASNAVFEMPDRGVNYVIRSEKGIETEVSANSPVFLLGMRQGQGGSFIPAAGLQNGIASVWTTNRSSGIFSALYPSATP